MEAATLVFFGVVILAVVNFLGLREISRAIRESKGGS